MIYHPKRIFYEKNKKNYIYINNNIKENINIITTIYPIEYITNYIYGDNSNVTSIYPDDTDISSYNLTDKQLSDGSEKDLFIYMGKTDSNIAVELINRNKKLKLIDATYGMEYKKDITELFLNPANLLMIAQNIKNGLNEYIDNSFLKQEINDKFDELKLIISEVDANYKTTVENANKKTIYTNSNAFLFLEKYNLNVIVVNKTHELFEKNLALLNNDIENNNVKYFFYLEDTEIDQEIKKHVDDKKLTALEFRNLKNITDSERNTKITYEDLMKENLETIKKEIY